MLHQRKTTSHLQTKRLENTNSRHLWLVTVVIVVVSHIQRIGCQPEKTTLHGGQSRSWSAEQGKYNKEINSGSAPPPRDASTCLGASQVSVRLAPVQDSFGSWTKPMGTNQHELACFGLSSPWPFPSRSGIVLHAVVQRWLSRQRSRSAWCWEDWWRARTTWGGRNKSEWGISWTTLELSASTLTSGRLQPRTRRNGAECQNKVRNVSRRNAVSFPSCTPQTLRTRSTSCVKPPRYSHLPP